MVHNNTFKSADCCRLFDVCVLVDPVAIIIFKEKHVADSTSTLAISLFFSVLENPVSWSFTQKRNQKAKLLFFFFSKEVNTIIIRKN